MFWQKGIKWQKIEKYSNIVTQELYLSTVLELLSYIPSQLKHTTMHKGCQKHILLT